MTVSRWDRLIARALAPLGAVLVRLLGRTMRITVLGDPQVAPLWATARPLIYAVWHGQILMMPLVTERLRQAWGARPVHVLTSASPDGELLAEFVRRFGFGVIRGSSSRGGASALRQLARRVRAGVDVVVAPDGPRGPRARAQAGVIVLAELTGAPLVPVAFVAEPAWRLGSWDGFEIPRPFGRGALAFGAPLPVRGRDREVARKDLESALAQLGEAARNAVGRR
ncbi:MAG: hypothetical protein DME17_17545 [Candidatus Rokuibacteriota bacterium]|nr:MAG: hypothetical protein DME17_17545 [Candidatus Rokubacteria bacterium]